MKKLCEARREFIARVMLPANPNIPGWCSSKEEKVLIFRKSDPIKVVESENRHIEITYPKTISITKEEYEKFFKKNLLTISVEGEESTPAKGLWELD